MRNENRQGGSSCPQGDGKVAAEGANIRWQAATRNALRTTRSTYTRERRRPELRVYFIGRRFGSIFARPV
ncbi:MAG TPA: hypothetical protein VGI59_05925, partial [Candidatus Udaeobacter sp.]